MKLVAITRVKDESDIIESFARHNCAHFDSLIIMDHASTDNTLNILNFIKEEGLPIVTNRSNNFNSQSDDLTQLMRIAFDDLGADWVVPLDADEFIEIEGGRLHTLLPAVSSEPYHVAWNNFAYIESHDLSDIVLPVLNLKHRLPASQKNIKVLIPKSIGGRKDAIIAEGNHHVLLETQILASKNLDGAVLCHFPIRSPEQYARKIAFGTWRYLISFGNQGDWGRQYKEPYAALKSGLPALKEQMLRQSLNYDEGIVISKDKLIFKPLIYLGGECQFSARDQNINLLSDLCTYSESMALEIHLLRSMIGAQGPSPLKMIGEFCCTLAKILEKSPGTRSLAKMLYHKGDDILLRAKARREASQNKRIAKLRRSRSINS